MLLQCFNFILLSSDNELELSNLSLQIGSQVRIKFQLLVDRKTTCTILCRPTTHWILSASILLKKKVIDKLFLFSKLSLQHMNLSLELDVVILQKICSYLLPHRIIVKALSFLLNVLRAQSAHLEI